MSLLACFKVALGALRLNALRTLLAMLGIIIGVASVITMSSISSGAQQRIEAIIDSLGTNLLIIRPGSGGFGGRRGGAGTNTPFTERDVTALRNELPDISAISGEVNASAPVVLGNNNWTTNVVGGHQDYLEARAWVLKEGRLFSQREVSSKAKVAIIGQTIVKELFDGSSPIGEKFRIKNIPFEVIGVLSEKGQSSFGTDQDDLVIAPISTVRARISGRSNSSVANAVPRIYALMTPGTDMTQAQAEIEDLLRERRRIKPGAEDDFSVRNLAEFIRSRTETQRIMGVLLAITATISLIVGGIGIMNIMLVSVTERTREIGVRMAIGARGKDIMTQFLVEAITLCFIGGLIGLALGAGLTAALAKYTDFPQAFEGSFVIVAVAASTLVGVFFGFYPAKRASKLNPIDALRFE
ncbi:ABC transporter permease [Kordiimonas sp. SCSIO 12610]|uniref:ABC transporter permease n=1 Tax=Kordiimonas sp. SCSIO 12610 TaxID=2829597 RepID=UPI002108F35D|nr:ABC transporter permease [Kordiimonas sp. SCSIO 12610]UTW54694.1 ABC transporter permease [Kordiimonas sp. SCSIO 12610]